MMRQLRRLRRPLLEFLAVPVLIVAGFVVLAEVVDWADNQAGPRHAWGPLRLWLSQYVGDTQSAIGVLSAIAGSLFTITSITWTAISTARSDPAVGTLAIHTLQRLLHAWPVPAPRGAGDARIAFDDRLPDQLMDTMESLVVAASESRQHQTAALILSVFATGLPALSPELRTGAEGLLRVAARAMPEFLPTRVLCDALTRAAATCRAAGSPGVAAELEQALAGLREG